MVHNSIIYTSPLCSMGNLYPWSITLYLYLLSMVHGKSLCWVHNSIFICYPWSMGPLYPWSIAIYIYLLSMVHGLPLSLVHSSIIYTSPLWSMGNLYPWSIAIYRYLLSMVHGPHVSLVHGSLYIPVIHGPWATSLLGP